MRFPAYFRGHSLSSPLSVKRTACTLTGAEADAAACFSHGRNFPLLPPQRQGLFRAPGAGTCLRRVTFVNSDKSDQKRRQKLRFCTSSARYTCLLPSSFFLTRPAFSYPLSVSRLCQHSFPLPLPLAVAEISPLPNYSPQIYHTPCPTGTPTFAALRRQRRDLIIANPVEANTPTVAEASGRGSLRAGERRHSPFDRQ